MISLKSASGMTIPLFILRTYYVPELDTRNTTVNITKVVSAYTVFQLCEVKVTFLATYLGVFNT